MYFDYRHELKKLIQFYYQMEEEQLLYIHNYELQINLAKQHQHQQLLIEVRQMLSQAQYLYHSIKTDRLELQNNMKYLID